MNFWPVFKAPPPNPDVEWVELLLSQSFTFSFPENAKYAQLPDFPARTERRSPFFIVRTVHDDIFWPWYSIRKSPPVIASVIDPSWHCKIRPPRDISIAVCFVSFPRTAFAASKDIMSIGPEAETPYRIFPGRPIS